MTDEFYMIEIENDWIVRCNKKGMSRNDVVELLNIYKKENEQLKKQNDDLKRQNKRRKRKNKHHRAVIEELGAVIIGYKGELKKLHQQIHEIKEQMGDSGALTKRQLEEILND